LLKIRPTFFSLQGIAFFIHKPFLPHKKIKTTSYQQIRHISSHK
jgi:hypothetical protein